MADNVHQPQHYQHNGIETIDYIAAALGSDAFRDYCIGNVIKYVSRWRHKNGEEDLRKANVYLNWAINGNPGLKLEARPDDTAGNTAAPPSLAEQAAARMREFDLADDEAPLRAWMAKDIGANAGGTD